MLRSRARHLLAVVMIAGLFVPATAFSRVLYACKMSGGTVARCLCSGQHLPDHKATGEQDSLRKAECCERQTSSDAASSAVRTAGELNWVSALGLGAPALELEARAEPQLTALTAPRSRAPPASRVPLYRKNCALLN